MKIESFELERSQSLWENRVDYNLTESGVHPYNIKEIMNQDEIDELLSLRIGYGQTNGSIELRKTISNLYPSSNIDQILVTNGSAEANFISMWSLLKPED
ncbi:MAG: aspartate aminotransferase, partial [Candidatus Heimdallarchaeota archaeon]|nr:aspartate aminotransferase [Candidatus Heimdallarchaeota archaeon]MCK5145088.1 aspartate aminotransferase [Candidatus Heimdallarchaeota archaeon]